MCLLSDSCRWSVAGIGSCFGITICVSNAQVKHNPNGVQQSKQQLLRLDRERERGKTDWKYTYWISKKAILNIIKFCLKIMRENWYGKYSAVDPSEQNKIDYWVVEMNGIVLEHTTHRHTHGTTPYINSLFSESTFSFLIDLAIAVLFFFSSFNLFLFVIQLLLLCIFHFFAFTLAHQWTKYAVGICYLRCAATTANR